MVGKQYATTLVLANVMCLAASVVREVVGDDVSNTVGGERITDDLMDQISSVQIQKHFQRYLENDNVA
jgi:hypothetical protein